MRPQVKEHDDIPGAEEVSDTIKKAILLAKTPDPLRTHLQLNAGTYSTFNDLRDAVHPFPRARKGLTTMGAGNSKNTDDHPMGIDVLYGANAKKGKGKSKEGKGNNSKRQGQR